MDVLLDRVILYDYGVFFMDDLSNMSKKLTVKDQVVVAIHALLIFYALKIAMSDQLSVSMLGFFCMWFNLKMFDVYAFKRRSVL